MLTQQGHRLVFRYGFEEVWIEAWGKDAVRVRATKSRPMKEEAWALTEPIEQTKSSITVEEDGARLSNGKIYAAISKLGKIMVRNSNGKVLLEEYARNRTDLLDPKCSALNIAAREFKPRLGGEYHITLRLESLSKEEKLHGMG